jgi:geranylgeranyl pyrophosphate synthase
MIKVDTKTLTGIINKCFDNASDGRFSEAQQAAFLADGKRLRGLLLNLLSAQFDDGTQAVFEANNQLASLNSDLSNSAASLANIAQTLNSVASLVSNLDKLLNVASSFL